MGSFSFLRADVTIKKANIVEGDQIAILIPEKFGGGSITTYYLDFGRFGTYAGIEQYDVYELLAFWNADHPYLTIKPTTIGSQLEYDGEFPNIKAIDGFTDHNRSFGIDIGCSPDEIEKLQYPLKLVGVQYAKKHSYEDCPYRSFCDPEQGFYEYNWDRLPGKYKSKSLTPGLLDLLKGRIEFIKSVPQPYAVQERKALEERVALAEK